MARKNAVATEDIIALRQKGFTAAEIARMLNISVSTVNKRIQAYKDGASEPKKVKKEFSIEDILERKEKGLSNYKIASEFGVSEQTIRTRLKKAEKIESSTPPEAEKVEKIEKTAPEPVIQPETAKITPISAPAPSTSKKREDIPDDLLNFAYIPNLYEFYNTIFCQAMPEPWAFKKLDSGKEVSYPGMSILPNYINRIFKERAREYNSCADEECDKIILFRKDYCYIHTGLYTPEYKGLYLVFEKNRHPYARVPWYCVGVKSSSVLATRGVFQLPEHRSLMPDVAKPFNPDLPIVVNADHILKKPENRERLPESIRNAWNLLLLFETAVELARRKARITPQIVVTYYRVAGHSFLLPLYLTNPEKPDIVAVLEDVGDHYFCRTAITPNMAYASARLNGRPTVDWLTDLVEPVE